VLVSLPAGNFGKRVGKTNKRANALAGPRQSHLYALTARGLRTAAPVPRGLLGVVMAWQRPVPAFPDGMTGQPIWSLHSRARSARCALGGERPHAEDRRMCCAGAPGEIRTTTSAFGGLCFVTPGRCLCGYLMRNPTERGGTSRDYADILRTLADILSGLALVVGHTLPHGPDHLRRS